jgi:hypothetical protein
MENVYKKFNKEFFKSSKRKILWFDKDGLINFPDFVIRLTIDNVSINGNYNGYFVEIIHKTNGTISKKFFRFIDHLEMIHRENSNEYCHVWDCASDGRFEWYISKPKDTSEMVKVIDEWIGIHI